MLSDLLGLLVKKDSFLLYFFWGLVLFGWEEGNDQIIGSLVIVPFCVYTGLKAIITRSAYGYHQTGWTPSGGAWGSDVYGGTSYKGQAVIAYGVIRLLLALPFIIILSQPLIAKITTPNPYSPSTWEIAAQNGDATAQFNMGVALQSGKKVKENFIEAANWYEKAAMQGHADAQNNLGILYYRGKGRQQNYILAYAWCYLAQKQGSSIATKNLQKFEDNMTSEQKNIALKKYKELINR